MAQSPLDAVSPSDISGYLKNWDALSAMIGRGRSFSGFERHCCFLNTGPSSGNELSRFADISAASGFDLIDDGRALARVDWDRDGDLDFWLTNRSAPRLRLLKNNLTKSASSSWLTISLQGSTCNRDAIGAVLQFTIADRKQTRVLRAGEGFQSQSSKRIHFGLGVLPRGEKGQLTVHWPGSATETIRDLIPGNHYHLKQGSPPRPDPSSPPDLVAGSFPASVPTEQARVVLTQRIPTPVLGYVDFSGALQKYDPSDTGGSPTLINLWASWCAPCVAELEDFSDHHSSLKAKNLRTLALTIEAVSDDGSKPDLGDAKKLVKRSKFPFQVGVTDANGLRLLTVLHSKIFSRERPLPLPTSFLVDKHGQLAVIYRGPVKLEQLLSDLDLLEAAPVVVFKAAFPFPSSDGIDLFPLGELDFAKAYQDGGYLEGARRHARRAIAAEPTNNPVLDAANRARAWYFLGSLEQSARQWVAAAEAFGKSVEHAPAQPLLKVAHGAVLWQSGAREAAQKTFAEAAQAKPNDINLLNALGKAHLQIEQPGEAVIYLQQAQALAPKNLTIALTLALAHEKAGNPAAAVAEYRRLLQSHLDSASIKNNLAYLLATCSDPALRDPEEALALATQANAATNSSNPGFLDTLATAQAETGTLSEALTSLQRAIRIAQATGQTKLALRLREKRSDYAARQNAP